MKSPTETSLKFVGIDIGIKTLSFIKLELPAGSTLPSKTLKLSERMIHILKQTRIVIWDVVDFLPGKSATKTRHDVILDALINYMRISQPDLLVSNSSIVLEAQRTSLMKKIQSSLYTLARFISPEECSISCQAASKKLNFSNYDIQILTKMNSMSLDISSYCKRKKASVKLCEYCLVWLSDNNEMFKKKFLAARKQDDLSDAFLHALVHASETYVVR